ncbi:aminoglycoside 6-adenylyltransferase [Staphylococcus pasteuri]|uniref:aminoglycoside 6-adenylyltransferase n=1 Tax=Staphylococcus pasteuri TaxID=45972 RepID=UPI0015E72F12|nr:aminoglycoside 6-adenylyltransferase [Staphylococcus pasteuri]
MRSSEEIFGIIKEVARQFNNICAVCINDSRVNKSVKKDKYQDFDIVFIVEDLDKMIIDLKWLDKFGKRIITQYPDLEDLYPSNRKDKFSILMMFDDYNRIDLTLIPKSYLEKYLENDSLTEIIYDKENIIKYNKQPNDEKYWVREPFQKIFDESITEFYMIMANVYKGLKRRELLYSIQQMDLAREMLLLNFSWKYGYEFGYRVNFGKNYKWLPKFLNNEENEKLKQTYSRLDKSEITYVMYKTIEIFDEVTFQVATLLEFKFDKEKYKKVKEYIEYQ